MQGITPLPWLDADAEPAAARFGIATREKTYQG